MDDKSTFGSYELLKRIAYGGMAEIHLARTTSIGGFEKLLALKVIHPKFSADQEFIDMLVDEAKIAVQLSHVNVGQIFDLGQVDGVYYIAMEFVDGKDLYQLLVRCSELGIEIPFDIIAFIAREVAAGLHYAHTRADNYGRPLNIIHRDVSPQNVLVSYDGQVKIVDFGIAKASQRSRETEGGIIKGKFFYMSPEQAWGDTLDGRSDIFSAGICLYEMLTGEMLYNEDKALLLLEKVRKAEIPNMRSRRPDIPPLLETITLKALQRDVGDRYQTGEEFQGAISGYLYGNWPSFNRRRVADFMKQVFGDQRFILPMPKAEVKAPTPSPANQSFMDAEDFEHVTGQSVIFDLSDLEGEEILDDDDDEAPTVAAAFADEDMQAAFMEQMGDEESESTMNGAWDASESDYDQDRTAILDATNLNFANLPPIGIPKPAETPPAPEPATAPGGEGEARTRVFSKQDLPPIGGPELTALGESTASTPPLSPAQPLPLNPSPSAVNPSPIPSDQLASHENLLSEITSGGEKTSAVPASLLAKALPQAMMGSPAKAAPVAMGIPRPNAPPADKTPMRQTPRIPEVDPAPSPVEQRVKPRARSSAPDFAPKKPTPSKVKAKGKGKRSKVKTTSARKKAKGGFAGKLLSPAGITVMILSGLLIYGAMAFLPTLFAEAPPQQAMLVIKSQPPDAKIIHNGQDTGLTTKGEITGLVVGTEHKISLELPGYKPLEQMVSIPVEGNQEGVRVVTKKLFLEKAPGTLKINSEPSGAEVYKDGKYLGLTPLVKTDIKRDKREFNLKIGLSGKGYYEKNVTLSWGSETLIEQTIKLKARR